MKNIFLTFITLGIIGCSSAPLYTGPSLSPLKQEAGGINHRVEAGQTLWRISKIYNVEISDILKLNHLSENTGITTGQTLLIPPRANAKNSALNTGGDDFIWPLKGKVIAGFGTNYHNLLNKGLNIRPYADESILAARTGRVVFYADHFGNFGKTIIIEHGDGLRSIYSRVQETFVRPGNTVRKGDVIARAGNCARDKNIYLHFEIRKGALAQNPLFYLP